MLRNNIAEIRRTWCVSECGSHWPAQGEIGRFSMRVHLALPIGSFQTLTDPTPLLPQVLTIG